MIEQEIKTKFAPSKYQQDIYDAVLHTDHNIVIQATAGCLHPDMPILMFNGLIKKAKNIEIGDKLMGVDSTLRKVLNIKSGEDKLYKIIPTKGSEWICNSKHILTVYDEDIHSNNSKRGKKGKYQDPLVDISISEILKLKLVSSNTYSSKHKRYKLQRTGVEFEEKVTLLPPYLMGLWLGDGSTGNPHITSKDQEIIDYCKSLKFENVKCKIVPEKNHFSIRLTSDNHAKIPNGSNLIRNEIRKAVHLNNDKKIPRNYLINSSKKRLELLAGLIDSDGYFGGGVYEISTKFNSLKNDILYLCRSLGLAAYAFYKKKTIRSIKFEGFYWCINISGELSNIPVLLKRKKASPRKQIKSVLRTGFKIEEFGIGEWNGFQVDNDNRFLLGDFTITHNSGKTSTIIEASKLIPKDKCSLFAAFNKSIVEELTTKLPSYIMCSTLHSIGMNAIMSHYRTTFRLNEFKSFKFIEEVIKSKNNDGLPEELKREDGKDLMAYRFSMKDAINLARMTMTELNEEALYQMCCYYNIDLFRHELMDIATVLKRMEVYNRSFTKKHNEIDYVDMIHIPISNWKIKMPTYDYIFIDELQDLSKFMHQFIERMIGPKSRTISVGDFRQSIYSFAGADIYSFQRFEKRKNTITLPLSISYRCATNIVALAKTIYPEIEPCETNPPGEIRYGEVREIMENDMVLCRNNRPLMVLYFQLLEDGKNPIIIGKDIQEGLQALISKYLKKDTDEGVKLIYERLKALKEELKSNGVKNITEHPKYEALYDKVRTVEIIANRCETMKEVHQQIEEMFKEKENCIKLLTIHRSKGLESRRVFYIERFNGKRLLPSPFAIQEWERIQEQNLRFVMVTRAKKSLILINNIED